jgi:FtsX extracellular domain
MMQTDELRAELAELAREVEPVPADLAAVRHRVARRNVASASVAVVLVVGLVAGGIALTRSNQNRVHVAESVKKVALAKLPRFDAAVVLPAGATGADAAQVEAVLDATAVVRNYAPLPVRTLAGTLRFNPAQSAKALLARVCATPPSYVYAVGLSRVAADPLGPLVSAIGAKATVQSMGLGSGRKGFDAEVFMRVRATPRQLDALRAAIDHDPDVTKFTFVSHQAALAEFKKLFADQPVLITNTTASQLPESFRLVVRDGGSLDDLARRYRALPGVDEVTTASTAPLAGYAFLSLADACSPSP